MRIFISHKTRDRDAVMLLKRMVEKNCTRMKVFASCDVESLRGGRLWSPTIHSELDEADYFVLLFTRPEDNWDWCLYEAGYYLGRRSAEKAETLLVIHPAGVVLPAPLQDRQSVTAEPDGVKAFLKTVFRPGSPDCHWISTEEELCDTAEKIAQAVRPLGAKSRELNLSMTVVVPAQEVAAGAAHLPDDAWVVLKQQAAELFGLSEDEQCPWPRFLDAARRHNFDVPALAQAVQHARGHQAVPTALDQFRGARDQLRYRPIIYSVDSENSGRLSLKVVFWSLSGEAEPELFNAFERVRLVFNLATKFRRQIGEQHAAQAMAFRNKPESERTDFLKRVLYDIDNLAAEADAEKLADRERLIEAFEEPQRATIRGMYAKWDVVFAQLREAVESGRCDAPDVLLRPMRLMNREFLLLSAERLRRLVSEFPLPEPDPDATEDGPQTAGTSARACVGAQGPPHGHAPASAADDRDRRPLPEAPPITGIPFAGTDRPRRVAKGAEPPEVD